MSIEDGKMVFEREFKGLILGLYPLVLILSLWVVYTVKPLREFLSVLVPVLHYVCSILWNCSIPSTKVLLEA